MNRVCANGKSVRLAEFAEFLNDVQRRAIQSRIPFEETKLPGKKREFIKVARKLVPSLREISDGTFESYMHQLGYRFPPSGVDNYPDAYRVLFPEVYESMGRERFS